MKVMKTDEIIEGLSRIAESEFALTEMLPDNESLKRDMIVCTSAIKLIKELRETPAERIDRKISPMQLDMLACAAFGDNQFLRYEQQTPLVKAAFRGLVQRVLTAMDISVEKS